MRWLAVALLLALPACGSAFQSMPAPDRARFDRCRSHMRPVVCDAPSSLRCAFTMGDSADAWAQLPPDERTPYLVGHGCPEPVAAYGAP